MNNDDNKKRTMPCQYFEEPRRELLNSLNAILTPNDFSHLSYESLVEFILYGNEWLRQCVNKFLIEATLNFLHVIWTHPPYYINVTLYFYYLVFASMLISLTNYM